MEEEIFQEQVMPEPIIPEQPAKVRTVITSKTAKDKTLKNLKKLAEYNMRLSNNRRNIYG